MPLSGTLHEGDYTSVRFKNGLTFHYILHVPAFDGPCALNVNHDGLNEAEVRAMELLAESGDAPHCVTLGLLPGYIADGCCDGQNRNMRMDSYDVVSADYPNFIVEELIPFLKERYHLILFDRADMHMTSGGSSGGISAWNIAWQRNDYFRRVYMSSPTFSSMSGGNEYPVLIRKYETKPIRVFTDYSENEPDDYFGSSYCAALEGEMALRFAGYDMMSRYYPGEGHCSRRLNDEAALERMRFLWKDWSSEPIRVKKLSSRAEKVIALESAWEMTDCAFPEKLTAVSHGRFFAEGVYSCDETHIFFTPAGGETFIAASGFSQISALVISADKKRLYVGDKHRSCVYACLIEPDGRLGGRFIHATLHHEPDYEYAGARDLCVSSCDRVLAVTDLGIQFIRSYGLIDVILALPDGKIPDSIEFGSDQYLYARCGRAVYRRKILDGGRPCENEAHAPLYISYYD